MSEPQNNQDAKPPDNGNDGSAPAEAAPEQQQQASPPSKPTGRPVFPKIKTITEMCNSSEEESEKRPKD